MEKFLYAKFEDNVIPSELEVYEFTRADGAMVLSGQTKLRFIGSVTNSRPAIPPMQMPIIPAAIAPIVAPNSAPGKDVSPIEPPSRKKGYDSLPKTKVEYHTTAMPGDTITLPAHSGDTIKMVGPTEEQLEARRILAKMDPALLANAAGEDDIVGAAEAESETVTTIIHQSDGSAGVNDLPSDPAPKRKRRAKAVEVPAEPVGEPTDFKLSEAAAPEQLPIPDTAYYAVPEKPTIEGLPTAEELKGFRARLFNLTSEVLPKGGMVPTEGIGGINAKVRLFVTKRFGVTDLKYLTKEQWEEFLTFSEEFAKKYDSAALVGYIHDKIGLKE